MLQDHPWLFATVGLAMLAAGGEAFARSAAPLARRSGTPPLVIGLTLAAFFTSMPALAVAAHGARALRGDLALGTVVGSAIATVGCILAVCAVIHPLRVSTGALRRTMPAAAVAALAATVVLADGRLGRPEAALLLTFFAAHAVLTVRACRRENGLTVREEFAAAMPPSIGDWRRDLAVAAAGLLSMGVGAGALVPAASDLAFASGQREAVVGLSVVAVGAILPRFSAALVGAFRRQPDLILATLVGGFVFDLLGVLAIVGLTSPVRAYDLRALDLGVLVGSAVLLLPFMKAGFRLQRWEGALLFAGYIAYLVQLAGRAAD